MAQPHALPAGITVFERGWLSANNILFHGSGPSALVDSGYATHASQTVALVRQALGERPLDLLLNTHLHSDHCGGNAALQAQYPDVVTCIPPGLAGRVHDWDPVALTYEPTGQHCPRFRMDRLLEPGTELALGDRAWQVHGAPGHDQHSVVLFEPQRRILISADALWSNGFGVVFQELEGEQAFEEVGATLDLIEALQPRLVIPGHGGLFTDVTAALEAARRRLRAFRDDPVRHAGHAAKVLLKFKLLELQRVRYADLERWALGTVYFPLILERHFPGQEPAAWFRGLVDDLIAAKAAALVNGELINA
ncbi:MBL fold metallo-hydrolase [Ramlibacter sp. RBP-2]|uniref:MBL fold metallo-hydrolase n=1 Tax=Ramlibacter lithotrophicus TaxID=2606681 RepID=A0A7X6DJ99_9BURK|nr:MBL fold metallo-hydrolase [Ramlibacter lithotrophicus]NKE68160.1 MBL fold metallo-hydrolase [Ramlibacter lithotrophicus]